MEITRLAGGAIGRNRAVAWRDLVWTVATASGDSLRQQTETALAQIERNLEELGSDKTKLLQVTVYLAEISAKPEMDAVWNAWIGPGNWPQRACVGVALAGDDLVEIVVTAAR